MPICNDIIKSRDVCFSFTTGQSPSASALALLEGVDGFVRVETRGEFELHIEYDIKKLTLQMIENALVGAGLHLRNNLWQQIRRAVFAYCEEALRERLGVTSTTDDQNVFCLPQTNLAHDPRPDNWRNYT